MARTKNTGAEDKTTAGLDIINSPEHRYLVRFNRNYADEFDCHGLFICTGEEWYKFRYQPTMWQVDPSQFHDPFDKTRKRSEYDYSTPGVMELYFGTNEAMRFESMEDYFSSFQIEPLTLDEYKILDKVLNCGMMVGSLFMRDEEGNDDESRPYDYAMPRYFGTFVCPFDW